ncbi:hypothetical protein [Sutcliffiella horikoshii]|uniref:hypothetical protein n=1 Tax=Sutcliffiella horikoshii TaxID=79883 RepID=UPI00384D88E9
MVKRTLVEKDYIDGECLITYLDKENIKVHSAFWLYNDEINYWQLMLSTKLVDEAGTKEVYTVIKNALDRMAEKTKIKLSVTLQDISVISPSHPLVLSLGRELHTGPEAIDHIRYSKNTANNIYIEDAYIYRIQ